jgi:hypothetical protein
LGFLQRDQAWVQNWFATSDEVIKLSAVKPLADDGNTYVMKYHEDDGKRYGVEVQPDWAKNSFFSPTNTAHDFRFEGPWYVLYRVYGRSVSLFLGGLGRYFKPHLMEVTTL